MGFKPKITVCGLTGLALLTGNVSKTGNFHKPTIFEQADSGLVRVETVDRALYSMFKSVLTFVYSRSCNNNLSGACYTSLCDVKNLYRSNGSFFFIMKFGAGASHIMLFFSSKTSNPCFKKNSFAGTLTSAYRYSIF